MVSVEGGAVWWAWLHFGRRVATAEKMGSDNRVQQQGAPSGAAAAEGQQWRQLQPQGHQGQQLFSSRGRGGSSRDRWVQQGATGSSWGRGSSSSICNNIEPPEGERMNRSFELIPGFICWDVIGIFDCCMKWKLHNCYARVSCHIETRFQLSSITSLMHIYTYTYADSWYDQPSLITWKIDQHPACRWVCMARPSQTP